MTDRDVREIYLIELYNQCQFAVQAHAAASSSLDRFGRGPADTFGAMRRHQREVFRNLHSLVCHAGNAARLLWPDDSSGEPIQSRAAALREALGPVEGMESLNRLPEGPGTVVGGFAERLGRWVETRGDGSILLDYIAGTGEERAEFAVDRRIRTYDPATGQLTLWDESVEVGEVTDALRALSRRAEELLGDPDELRGRH